MSPTAASLHPAPPAPLAEVAQRALTELARASGNPAIEAIGGHRLLMERARLAGLRFGNGRSAGGSCRFLAAREGTIAVNLPRASDWELVPAWLEGAAAEPGDWAALGAAVAPLPAARLVERGRMLGLAVAPTGRAVTCTSGYWRITGPPMAAPDTRRRGRPRVIDLSALWAGPLCGHLLHQAGAEVIKVESVRRPDGAREGNPAFYGLLNQGKRCLALDLTDPAGRRALRALILRADVVIEAARPRALRQMGMDAEALLRDRPGLTWISITGYGRDDPEAGWVAFGDDAAVAAGFADVMKAATGSWQFAGDAIADPLTGAWAAVAGWRSWQSGGGRLVSLALAEVAACSLAEAEARLGAGEVIRRFGDWWREAENGDPAAGLPPRPITEPVAPLGAHTAELLAELDLPC